MLRKMLVSSIPTLRQAYASGSLSASTASTYAASESINDKVSLWQGDITSLEVDGIQNAANSQLRGGGGIDGAIHRAAGPELLKACRTLKGCETGYTKVTEGFNLPSRYVLHTVGPIYRESSSEGCQQQLASCYQTTLELAVENGMKTVALCGVSTGVYGFPLRAATDIALKTTREFLEEHKEKLDRVVFCNFGDRDVQVYKELSPKYFPPSQ